MAQFITQKSFQKQKKLITGLRMDKLSNFIHNAMSRQMRLAKMLDRCSWNEKDLERCRKFYKNKRWADYCQNLRYELAGL